VPSPISRSELVTAHFRGPGARRPPAKVVHAPLGVTIIDIDEETVVLLDEAIAALMNRTRRCDGAGSPAREPSTTTARCAMHPGTAV
jgi:hypothetical protein